MEDVRKTAEDERVERMFKIRRTIFQMLKQRRYLVKEEDLHCTLDIFRSKLAHDQGIPTIATSKIDDRSDKILVFFCTEAKPGIDVFKDYIEKMKTADTKRSIVTIPEALTSHSRKALEHLAKTSKNYVIEHFFEKELLVNITMHNLVPHHKVLTNEEKIMLLEKYRLKETQLPRIENSDPIARFYGLQTGQVVKITRPSETAGRYVTYRLVL